MARYFLHNSSLRWFKEVVSMKTSITINILFLAQRERERGGETDRQRQRETETDRQTDRQRQGQTETDRET